MTWRFPPPAKRLFFLLRSFWRLAIPFWMFRDAHHGTPQQRSANYRYNRARRNILPFYIAKWIGIATCLMMIMQILTAQMLHTPAGSAGHLYVTLFCMSAGIGFAFACVVIAILCASYVFLTCVQR